MKTLGDKKSPVCNSSHVTQVVLLLSLPHGLCRKGMVWKRVPLSRDTSRQPPGERCRCTCVVS